MSLTISFIPQESSPLSSLFSQVFLYQLLRALAFIHETGVLHRDLKPKNILANSNCKLKICDFGLARPFVGEPTSTNWTDYVATRWYRAPELCGCFYGCYSHAVDIWSIGCIFAETLAGKPLFPGREAVSQLNLITDLVGKPSVRTIDRIPNVKARTFLHAMPPKPPKDFAQKFPTTDPLALDLLRDLLSFDPSDRPSALEALNHPYFQGLPRVQPGELPVIQGQFDFELNNNKLTEADVRSLIYMEVLNYHPHVMSQFNANTCQFSPLMAQVDGMHCNDLQHQFMHAESMANAAAACNSGPSLSGGAPMANAEGWHFLAARQQQMAAAAHLGQYQPCQPKPANVPVPAPTLPADPNSLSAASNLANIQRQQMFQMMAMQFQTAYDFHISHGHPPSVAAAMASQQAASMTAGLQPQDTNQQTQPHFMLYT